MLGRSPVGVLFWSVPTVLASVYLGIEGYWFGWITAGPFSLAIVLFAVDRLFDLGPTRVFAAGLDQGYWKRPSLQWEEVSAVWSPRRKLVAVDGGDTTLVIDVTEQIADDVKSLISVLVARSG